MADEIPDPRSRPADFAGAPGALETLGPQLRRAFTEVGFYFIRNHGVPAALVDSGFEAAARFHAQPLEAKLAMPFDRDNRATCRCAANTSRMNAVDGHQAAECQ